MVTDAHNEFLKPKLTYSNSLFCATNCPKPCTIIDDQKIQDNQKKSPFRS